MIQAFETNGNLPVGIHDASIDEFEVRFATNIIRQRLFKKLNVLINDLKSIGCKAMYVDGSYVTEKISPKDIDVCWDQRGLDLAFVNSKLPILFDLAPPRKAQQYVYGADILPAYIQEGTTGVYFIDYFQKDKNTGLPKGIVKLEIL